jgi:YVTN family beta-propeller protein
VVAESSPPGRNVEGSSGIIAFLIADVRGYTLFTQERGDEAAAKLAARFAQIAREGVEARGGTVIELRGDEALAVFASPRQALRAAVDLQQRFVDETVSDPSLPLPVGIGLDAGEAVPVEGGYRGGALNLAARLCGQAGPGEVLASYEVVHLARKVEGLTYFDQGTMHLKGLSEPVRVTRVIPESTDDPATTFSSILGSTKRKTPSVRTGRVFPHGLRSRRGLAVGLAILLAAAAIPFVMSRGGEAPGLQAIGTDSVGMIDLGSNRILDQVQVGTRPGAIVAGLGGVWVTNEEAGTVSRIDPVTRRVVDTIEVGSDPVAIAVGDGAVWVANSGDGTVMRINPDANKVVDTIAAGNGPAGVAVKRGFVWTANTFDGTVSRIQPESGTLEAIDAGANPTTIAIDRSVWVTNSTAGTVSRIDPGSAKTVASPHVGNGPTAVVVSGDDVWVANQLDGTVSRIDAKRTTVTATITVGQGPSAIAVGGGSVWVSNELDGSVSRIDPATNTVTTSIDVGGAPSGLAVVGDALWVTARGAGSVHRGGTLNLVTDVPAVPDPAIAYDPVSWSILTMTNDGLVGFHQTGGGAGSTLVPDLATSLPEPADDGLSYTFQLRRGVRYSTGTLVQAADVRYALERDFKSRSPTPYYTGILGGPECASKPRTCDLSRGIETDDASGTVTFHLRAPDPEFLFKLALPFADVVPSGTPNHGTDPNQTVPATGPYVIRTLTRTRVELARNLRFEEWSQAAKPDGYPDRITLDIDVDEQAQDQFIARIEKGEADSYLNLAAPQNGEELRARYTNQLHLYPLLSLAYLFMDTSRPPFDDVRVRRAINLAVDRARVVKIFGGPLAVRPTCQILPPNSQGYRAYCPYTLDPSPRGQWTAPDLSKAKKLVRESGTAGMKLTLVYPFFFPPGGGPYLVSVLKSLGYRATLDAGEGAPDDANAYFNFISNSKNHVQIGFIAWIADYPAASNFINVLLSCAAFVPNSNANQNYGRFCDPAIDAQIKRALELQLNDQSAAGKLWASIDRALVDQATIVPVFNRQGVDFLSKRVGNYQHNPLFGLLVDQLWVRLHKATGWHVPLRAADV